MKNMIEYYRKRCNLSQLQLAQKLDVSRQTINALETGKFNPSITLAFKIAKFFGVKIEEVFLYEEQEIY